MSSLPLIAVLVTLVLAAMVYRRTRPRPKDAPTKASATGALPAVATAAPAAFDPNATRIIVNARYKAPIVRPSAPAARLRNPRLVGLSGDHRSLHFPIVETGLTVGRGPANDIQLADRRVSSSHAWVGIIAGRAVLRDMQSSNGTFLNAAIDVPIQEAELHPNDTVLFGGHGGAQFRFVAD